MQEQERFAKVFYDAYPMLNTEDQRVLAEMAQLWARQSAAKPPSVLVIGTASSKRPLLDCAE